MLMRFLISFTMMLSFAACSFKKPSAQSPEEKAAGEVIQNIEQQKFNGQLSEENVRVDFVEAEEREAYDLQIRWPKDVPGMKVSVNGSHYQIINGSNVFIKRAGSGKEYDIHLIALNSIGGEISSLTLTKTAPLDLVVQAKMELNADVSYYVNRVYITDLSQIVTNGYNLTIEANKLISTVNEKQDNSNFSIRLAQIITSIPGTRANDFNHLETSDITIRAKKATGLLRIGMFGFDGLDGGPGVNGVAHPSLDGAPGLSGEVSDFVEPCIDPPCGRMISTLICTKNPTAGQNGKKGLPGGVGQKGMKGGDTGTLTVIVEDSTEFRLEVTAKAGAPGKGGPGGLGSPGGKGGAPGDNMWNKCANAPRGADGPAGDPGPRGADGEPGKIGDITTNIANKFVTILN